MSALNSSIWGALMSITIRKIRVKRDLLRHVTEQSDFDVLGVVYGSKAEINNFIATSTQQQNRTWGIFLISLRGTPNFEE